MDELDRLMAYEAGALSESETVALFADLVRTKLVWRLQGSYGRTARSMIVAGLISLDGAVIADTGE